MTAFPEQKSLCIVGTPGTAKSLLALHLAATYSWRHQDARVLYVSTDWSFEMAESCLADFSLNRYAHRQANPFLGMEPPNYRYLCEKRQPRHNKDLQLIRLEPEESNYADELSRYLDSPENKIAFLDLRSQTSGDDWGHLLKLSTVVRTWKNSDTPSPTLVIVDAIEGLELLAGDSDQFGQPRNRRQRIAQLSRLMKDLHWALVVEDRGADDDEDGFARAHYDEEFISDIVVRLGVRNITGYMERYVQVMKCRGTNHQMGKHPLLIRRGQGTYQIHGEPAYDDPKVDHAYMYAIPSLNCRAVSLIAGSKGVV